MGRPAYDVDLDGWKNRSAFHPANTRLKQLGHELARKSVVHLGELLHWLLPAGPEKSIAFQRLDEVRLYANMALAVNGGPREMAASEEYTEAAVAAALRDYERVELPGDPRIKEYEAGQRGESFPPGTDPAVVKAVEDFLGRPSLPGADEDERLAAAQVVRDGGFVIPESPKDALDLLTLYTRAVAERHPGVVSMPQLPGADADAPRQGMTGVAVQEAPSPAIPGEKPTMPDGTFHWTDESEHVQVDVYGQDGEVQLILTDQGNAVSIAKVIETPTELNQILSAMAASGDRVYNR